MGDNDRRTVMQPRQAQKRQLRSVKKMRSIVATPPAGAAKEQVRKQARPRQQRADRAKKQFAIAQTTGAATMMPPQKVVVARVGQVHQRGLMRAIVARTPAGLEAAIPQKVTMARSAQKAQLKTVRQPALKAARSK